MELVVWWLLCLMFGRCCLLFGGCWFGFGWRVWVVGCLCVGVGGVVCGWLLLRVGCVLFRGWGFWGLLISFWGCVIYTVYMVY